MADTNETIADIIAEMETERPGLMNAPINTNNSYYARRLKAAHERERGEREADKRNAGRKVKERAADEGRREVSTNRQPKLNMQEAMEIMKRVAKEEGLNLTFLKSDEGRGGYNYGGSCGDCIMLAPFVKCGACEKIDGYSVEQPCDNPAECMLISFFHELSHCKIANELSADRSTMQNELWVSMKGIMYAETKCKLEFSDAAVKWLLNENFSYAKEGGAK